MVSNGKTAAKMTVYGIKNCNTVKSAVEWLKRNNIDFQFHDYKSKGITDTKLKEWIKQVGWEKLVNKKGTTWRQLDLSVQAKINTEKDAIALMKDKTSIIKRLLLEKDGKVVALGFDEELYGKLL
jgi:arsenate reductase (glutaredoxin)